MLLYDARGLDDGPGLHALIVGVSLYDHLEGGREPKQNRYGVHQLSLSARTAGKLAALIVERAHRLIRPLKTCRLLLSSTDEEAAEIAAVLKDALKKAGQAERARTIDSDLAANSARLEDVQAALLEWHDDASVRADDATLFFFSGHGIQQSVSSSYLLVQDWLGGAQPLNHALYLLNIYNGMRVGDHQPNMARTQLYFIDACRNSLGALDDFDDAVAAQPFLVRRRGEDMRVAPIFYSSAPGRNAWSFASDGLSLFGGQLLDCLAGGAAEKRVVAGTKQWVVTIADLAEGLSNLANRFNRDAGGGRMQTFTIDHQTDVDPPVHFLDGPPTVEVVLGVDPNDARGMAEVRMAPPGAAPLGFGPPIDPLPYRCKLPAGTSALHVAVHGNCGGRQFEPPPDEYVAIKGPAFEHLVSLRPL